MKKFGIAFVSLAALSCCYCATLSEVAVQEGLTTLVDLVTKAGLVETIDGEGPFTIFAPTDEAFEKVPPEVLDNLMNDDELLKQVLLHHVVPARVMSSDVQDDVSVDTASEGNPIRTNIYLRSEFYPGFITISGKRIAKADIEADNGVIHTITEVLYPFPMESVAAVVAEADKDDSTKMFSTLLAAVEAAELTETLAGEGPFTVFAPTNQAFKKIPQADLDALLANKEELTKVLLRHVVPRTLYRKGISWMVHDTAAEGEQIQTQVFKGGVIKVVNSDRKGARIVEPDIIAKNGVIHAIDTVI